MLFVEVRWAGRGGRALVQDRRRVRFRGRFVGVKLRHSPSGDQRSEPMAKSGARSLPDVLTKRRLDEGTGQAGVRSLL